MMTDSLQTSARPMKAATCADCGLDRLVQVYSEAKRCLPCSRKRWLRSEHAKKREAEQQSEKITETQPKGIMAFGFDPLEIITVSGENFARATCAQCGAHAVEKMGRPLPTPNSVRKRFVATGWGVKQKCKCPECLRPKKINTKEVSVKQPFRVKVIPKRPSYIELLNKVVEKEAVNNNVTHIGKPSLDETSELAKSARRDAHSMLELYFDIHNGCFKESYTDKRIAEETGASESWVIKRREEEFGALGAPPEIQAMRLEIISLGRDIAQLSERIVATYKKNGWPV